MASQRTYDLGPVAMSATFTTNIFNCAVTSLAGPVGLTLSQPYAILRQLRIVNVTGSAATFTLWKGATGANAAGTEFLGKATSVAGNSYFEWFGAARFASTDFLVGGASSGATLTLWGIVELGFS